MYRAHVLSALDCGEIIIVEADGVDTESAYGLIRSCVLSVLTCGKSPYHSRYKPNLLGFNAVRNIIVGGAPLEGVASERIRGFVPTRQNLNKLVSVVDSYALERSPIASVAELQQTYKELCAATSTRARFHILLRMKEIRGSEIAVTNLYNQLFTCGIFQGDDYGWTTVGTASRMSYAVQQGLWRRCEPASNTKTSLLQSTVSNEEVMRYVAEDLLDARELWAGGARPTAFGMFWKRMSKLERTIRCCDVQNARCEYDKVITADSCGGGRLRGVPPSPDLDLEGQ